MDNQPTDNVTRWVVREERLLDDIDQRQHRLDKIAKLIDPYLTRSGNSEVGDLARSIRQLLAQTQPPKPLAEISGSPGQPHSYTDTAGDHIPEDRRGYQT